MNIVALSPNAWDGQWVNRQQLLSRIGSSQRVIYSSGAFAVWDRGSDDWRASPFTGRFVRQDNVWLDRPPQWLLRWPRVGAVDRLALAAAARRWRRQLDRSQPLVAL